MPKGKLTDQPLTPKQETFCIEYLRQPTASDAFRIAYPNNMNPATINRKASEALKNDKIRARISELKAEMYAPVIWERQDSLKVLAEIANSADSNERDRIAAIKELNSMGGFNAPAKTQFLGENGGPLNFQATVTFVTPEGKCNLET
jgi:hypothetical protein